MKYQADSAFGGNFALFVENLAEEAPLYPLHHHIDLAAVLVDENFHDPWVVQSLSDFFFSLESIVECGIALYFGMRDLDSYVAPISDVCGAVYGCHSAAGNQVTNSIVIKLVARAKRTHPSDSDWPFNVSVRDWA